MGKAGDASELMRIGGSGTEGSRGQSSRLAGDACAEPQEAARGSTWLWNETPPPLGSFLRRLDVRNCLVLRSVAPWTCWITNPITPFLDNGNCSTIHQEGDPWRKPGPSQAAPSPLGLLKEPGLPPERDEAGAACCAI